jgi:hypothetical protein
MKTIIANHAKNVKETKFITQTASALYNIRPFLIAQLSTADHGLLTPRHIFC